MPRPRVGISRCLLGDEVRYDGGHKRDPVILAAVGREVDWVPVCPEVEVGMGVPREPIHLLRGPDGVRLVGVQSGSDWTDRMRAWAQQRVQELRSLQLAGFVLKARSPTCGLRDVPVEGSFAASESSGSLDSVELLDVSSGRGMFADMLLKSLPDLPVEDEERLRDSVVRARFLERVRAYAEREPES